MTIIDGVWSGLGGAPAMTASLGLQPAPTAALPSSFAVHALGVAAFSAVGLAIAELTGAASASVDERGVADALRSEQGLRIADEPPEAVWDPLSKIYPGADGWVRLHGNYAQHRAALERVFGTLDPDEVAASIARRPVDEVEAAVHAGGGVAAVARSLEAWRVHPHGAVVPREPLVRTTMRPDARTGAWTPDGSRSWPLTGLRVLELTRVIAAPVAGRTLSWFGADVLRVEAPGHQELRTLVADTGPGKRSTELDIRAPGDRAAFERLLTQADVVLHGLRPGALEGLSLGAARRAALAPGLIDASLSAYGPGGPWSARRGFDSLMQFSSGLALAEARAVDSAAGTPRPLPCQILDHATGLLLAAAAVRAVAARARDGHGRTVTASLARTAAELATAERARFDGNTAPAPAPGSLVLHGPLGTTRHVPLPVSVDGVRAGWQIGAPTPGADLPAWA